MRQAHGFTLIELAVSLGVIGILAAVAVPQYRQYTVRPKVAEAFNTLSDLRVRMEQYYQDNRNYGPAGALACGLTMPASPQVTFFTYTCALDATDNNQAFTITASAVAGKGLTNTAGDYAYTINQSDVRRSLTVDATVKNINCWVSVKSGTC